MVDRQRQSKLLRLDTRACHQLSQIIDATSWIAARKLHAVLS